MNVSVVAADITSLISLGESSTLEVKANIPSTKILASLMSAFQNTNGGKILLGVSDNGAIVGIKKDEAQKAYDTANTFIKPYSVSDLNFIEIEGKIIAEIDINGAITRIAHTSVNGLIYARQGSEIRPISARNIIETIHKASPEVSTEEKSHIADLAINIEELNKRLSEANSWKSKFVDMLIGAVVGAVISSLFSFILG